MNILINACGCTNTCRHCGSSGKPPYGGFYSVSELREIAQEWGIVWPFFEATAHPEFPDILAPDIVGEGGAAYPPTNGFGIAEREDHKDVLSRLKDMGCKGLSFTLHGLQDRHDWFVARDGAFQTILTAGRRALDAGLSVSWNVFVDRLNPTDIPPLVELGQRELRLKTVWLAFADHRVSRRSWMYEKLRPRKADVDWVLEHLDHELIEGPLKDFHGEDHTQTALLSAWEADPCLSKCWNPVEPKCWPPEPPFDRQFFHIDRQRQVFLDPQCAEPILLGDLSDGRDEILRRVQELPPPPFVDITPEHAKTLLSDEDADLLHGYIGDVRYKAISYALYGPHDTYNP